MTLLWIDGFETYGTGTGSETVMVQSGLYSAVGQGCTSAKARTGTKSIEPGSFVRSFGVNPSTVGVGCAMYFEAYPQETISSYAELFFFYDQDGNQQCCFKVGQNGALILYKGNNFVGLPPTEEIGRSADGVVPLGQWCHMEVKFTPNDTESGIEIRVNEETVYVNSVFEIYGGASTTASVKFRCSIVGTDLFLDDLYAWDTTGSFNNDFIGDKRVGTILPVADTSIADWSPNTGATGYTQIDETPYDSDTSYVEATTGGDVSQFQLDELSGTVFAVSGFQLVTTARKTDAGPCSMRTNVITNGLTANGDTETMTTQYVSRVQIFEISPDTGTMWTRPELDNVLVEIERLT